jgi:hypothetical protein
MTKALHTKLCNAVTSDPAIFTTKDKINEALGNNPEYLYSIFEFTKNDLIRLEKLGFAVKCRYVTENNNPKRRFKDTCGPHRVRWVLFKEVFNEVHLY